MEVLHSDADCTYARSEITFLARHENLKELSHGPDTRSVPEAIGIVLNPQECAL